MSTKISSSPDKQPHPSPMTGEGRYSILKLIGEGTYGKVFEAEDLVTGEKVAIKRIKSSTNSSAEGGFHFTSIREIKVMKALKHNNLVSLLDIFVSGGQTTNNTKGVNSPSGPDNAGPDTMTDEDSTDNTTNINSSSSSSSLSGHLSLVMPLLQLDLKQVIVDRSLVLSMSHVKCIIKQILSGLEALHGNWFLHRDLSPANIFIEVKSGVCKIGDFGLTRTYGNPYPGILGRRRTFAGVMTPMVVTLWYRSPELLFGSLNYSTGVDIWSAGCILAELLPRVAVGDGQPQSQSSHHQVRQALFQGSNEIEQMREIFDLLGTPGEALWKESLKFPGFKRFTHVPANPNWPSQLFSLSSAPFTDTVLTSMLSLDPSSRPTATDLLQSQFFASAPKVSSEASLAKHVFSLSKN